MQTHFHLSQEEDEEGAASDFARSIDFVNDFAEALSFGGRSYGVG